MITKEECESLRRHLSILKYCPLPWSSDGGFPGEIWCANGSIVTTCEEDDGADDIAAIVNVFPALLDAIEDAGRELARLRDQLAAAREDASEMEKKAIAEGSEALALKAEVAALKASTTIVHVDESLRMAMDRENAELKARIVELETEVAALKSAAAQKYERCEICDDGNNCDGYTCPICTKSIGSQWQPMATALRNGTEILLSKGWNVFGQHLGFEVTNDWDNEYVTPDWRWALIPALPEPPKRTGDGQ